MKLTINTRDHGKVTFSQPGKRYIFVDLNGEEGTLGKQLCEKGSLSGPTIGCDEAFFETVCRIWWRQYLRNKREEQP